MKRKLRATARYEFPCLTAGEDVNCAKKENENYQLLATDCLWSKKTLKCVDKCFKAFFLGRPQDRTASTLFKFRYLPFVAS
uniref:hypothetical protein n=1 Tax=Okeania sp. SIO2F4 TaxID=2607790 RepID=UPI0025E0ADF2|nr:hypothetical protein [Okeania sp. SIO2F4]